MKGYIEDHEFGKIHVELRRGMTSVRFTYRPDGSLLMRAPQGVSIADLQRMVDMNRLQLRKLPKPTQPELRVGQVIECAFGCRVLIRIGDLRPGYASTQWDGNDMLVKVHQDLNLADTATFQFVSNMISQAMVPKARDLLLPYAQEVADSLGLKPTGFEVGGGMHKLGHCTSKGIIRLSRNLMFMPEELIRYIICHELAHLTHLNHSSQFHALCDQYCGGKEKELERQLRQFHFPILK